MVKYLATLLLFLYALQASAETRPLVFVSILPQKYFVEKVSEGLVDVEVMVGPGQNPTTYEPSPKQIAAITKADLYFSIDVPFEQAWLPRIRRNNPGMRLVLCCDQVIESLADGTRAHDDHIDEDPHVWTSPGNVIIITRLVVKELSKLDPGNADHYQSAGDRFIMELSDLDGYIREQTAPLEKRKMIVSHPSWSYLAAEYGFEQISIEHNGKDIKAASLRNLIEQARRDGIKAVFAQPQFNNKGAYIIAEELGGKVYTLDPLAYDYLQNMRVTTQHIVAGLSDE